MGTQLWFTLSTQDPSVPLPGHNPVPGQAEHLQLPGDREHQNRMQAAAHGSPRCGRDYGS